MSLVRHTQECLDAAAGRWPASGVWTGENRPASPSESPASPSPGRRPASIRLFENAFVENVLARAHPVMPIVWFGPLIAYGLYRGATALGPASTFGLFVTGWLVWTLFEYGMHRFLFHHRPAAEAGRLRSFVMHGYHHEFPRDKMRLVAPPLMSWPLAAVVLTVYGLALGADTGLALFAGTVTGYIAYDWTHYYVHHFRPRHRLGRWLQRYHLLHHYDDTWATHRFGVSSPLWDVVFGTYMPPSERASAQRPPAPDPARPPPPGPADPPRLAGGDLRALDR